MPFIQVPQANSKNSAISGSTHRCYESYCCFCEPLATYFHFYCSYRSLVTLDSMTMSKANSQLIIAPYISYWTWKTQRVRERAKGRKSPVGVISIRHTWRLTSNANWQLPATTNKNSSTKWVTQGEWCPGEGVGPASWRSTVNILIYANCQPLRLDCTIYLRQ